MITVKNKQIIDTLIDVTKSGDLVWVETDPASTKRSHQRSMYSFGEDGTKYEIDVKFTLFNSDFTLEKTPSLWIKNNNLPGGCYYMYGGSVDITNDLTSLRNIVKENYCKDMSPKIEDVEDQLEKICKGISISHYRENKINKIID